MKTFHVLNLGAGVQSTTLALMYCKGELTPKPDAAIFADTGWEPREIYAHVWWLAGELEAAGIPLYVTWEGDIRADALRSQVRGKASDGERWASMPFFTKDRQTGGAGQIRRQCTYEYKIKPIERATKRWVMGLKHGERAKGKVHLHRIMGISADEAHRMRNAEQEWATNVYPLCDWPVGSGRVMRRSQCIDWLFTNYPAIKPKKSACLGCPFHNDNEWRQIKEQPEYWQDVTEFDDAMRNCDGMRGDIFLHPKRIPLRDVDLSNPHEDQIDLFGQECEGMCGI